MNDISAFRLHTTRSKRSALCLAALAWIVTGAFSAGCGRSERPSIGTRLDTPIALASHPNRPIYYVLNASLSGEYQTGSLQAYGVPNQSTDSSAPLITVETPRLGTAIASVKTGEFLMAGFSGSNAELRVYPLNGQGLPTASSKASDSTVVAAGRIGTIQIHPVKGQSSLWTVVVSMADRSLDARVFVYKYSLADGFTRLAQFPSDFYTPSRENLLGSYSMAWGAPVVFPSQGLLAAFPQGTLGYFGRNPSAFEWLQGKVTLPNDNYDLRTVSAVVVDLNSLVSGQSVQKTVGFVPVAFNSSGQKANTSGAADAVGNLDYSFRSSYQSALGIDTDSAACQPSGPFANLTQPAAVVATNSDTADIIALSGWDQVANQLRSRLSAGESQPILGDVLTPSPVSMTSGISNLVGVRTLVPSIQLINTGTICTLAWLRVEVQRSSLGGEQSRLQIATDPSAAVQLSRGADLTGMAAFAVNGQSIMAGSFSNNKIQVLRVNGATLDNVGVFNP